MPKKDIRKMTMREVLSQMGYVLFPEQLPLLLKEEVFEDEMNKEENQNLNKQEFMQYIKENLDKIDKEKFVLTNAFNLQQEHNKTKVDLKEGKKFLYEKYYTIAKELLVNCKAEIPIIHLENNKIEIQGFLTANDFLRSEKYSRKQEALKQRNSGMVSDLQSSGWMKIMARLGSFDDFQDYLCYHPENGRYFSYMIKNNSQQTYLKKMENEGIEAVALEENKDVLLEIYEKEFYEAIEKHSDKFDMEKFLLVSAYRAKDRLENCVDYREEELIELMDYVANHIENKRLKISKNLYLSSIDDKKEVKYSYQELQDDLSRVVRGIHGKHYFSKELLALTKKSLLNGEISMEEVSTMPGLFELLNFNTAQKNKLMEVNSSNLDQLVFFDILTRDEIQGIINREDLEYTLSRSAFICLYGDRLIGKEDAMNLYVNNHIEFSQMLRFCQSDDELQTEVTEENFMKYYLAMKEDSKKSTEFERYVLLFKELKIKDKTAEEKSETIEKIVDKIFETSGGQEDFENLYLSNLLPIQTLVEWNGEEMIYSLISRAQLKPKDVKILLEEQKLDLKKVNQALENSDLSEEEKVNFVFSCFENVDDQAELLQTVDISEDLKREKKEASCKRQFQNTGIKRKENILNPGLRWQLPALMDEDWSSKVHKDGTVEFCLPNVNDGVVILEKMMKKTKHGIVMNYGTKTVLMSLEEFNKNKEEIIVDGKVNRTKVTNMQKEGTADGVVHIGSWGTNIMKNLKITTKSGYGEEKIHKMKTLCAQIDKDYQRQR